MIGLSVALVILGSGGSAAPAPASEPAPSTNLQVVTGAAVQVPIDDLLTPLCIHCALAD